MSMTFFIDTTLCTACRGCQVACKQWHDLPADATVNSGSYQNPPDLNFDTYKLLRMTEDVVDGRLRWLFFPDQCRHCIEPPCRDTAGDESAIFVDAPTGAVLYTANTMGLNVSEIVESCPYNIPRGGPNGTLAKCDMCLDRVINGLQPACVKTCPTGAMNFGAREKMLTLAQQRLEAVRKTYPKAQLLDPDDVRVVFLTAFAPENYHMNAVAANRTVGVTRAAVLARMGRPFRGLMSRLAS